MRRPIGRGLQMQTLTFFFAFVAVLALIGVAAWLVRRFASNRLGANTNRGRMPRLAVIDAAAVDGRRRLVLVRRDNVEHLLMIGGPSDIVVEPNIVRAMPGRDQMPPRPAVGAEQPPRIAPLPDAAWSRRRRRADARSCRAADARAAAAPAAPLLRRRSPPPGAAAVPERRSDPLAGFTPEPMGGRARAASRRRSRRADAAAPSRSEPMMPRAARAERAAEGAAAGPRARNAPPRRRLPPARAAAAVERRPKSRRDGAAARSRTAPAGRRAESPRRSRPNRQPARAAARTEAPRQRPRRRRAALKISKTRWRPCWAVRSLLREVGEVPA